MSNDAGGHQGPTPVRGSRRSLARGHRGPQRAAKPELVLEIVCAPDGWPGHGEQVVIRRSRYTSGAEPPYDETMPRHRVSPYQMTEQQGGIPGFKDNGRCPKCGANPQLNSDTIKQMLDALQAAAAGKSLTWRWDFRKRRLLS